MNIGSVKARRLALLCSGTGLLWLSSAAAAQVQANPAPQATPPTPSDTAPAEASITQPAPKPADAGTIVVTGSRITASGFNAPTPTTVIGTEQIRQAAQPNLYDTLAQLPALQGSAGTTNRTQNGNTSFGNNGVSSLNLRGLGSIRTLTLLDGQRVVPAYITGVTDVSQFPQLLIQRVDVVTGGASASWGSDAVAGVVNFVTEKKFEGFRANVQGGLSTYGDDEGLLAQAAAGTALARDRLHLEIAGEYYDNKGVPGGEVGGAQPNGRPDSFRSGSTSFALGAQPPGAPQFYNYPYNAQTTTLGRYGLITGGPLQGLAFDATGGVYNFQYGGNCISTVCQGGQQDNYITTTTIDNPIKRAVGYGRIGFDVTPEIEIYGTALLSDVKTENTPIAYPRRPDNLTISCSNPFLPAQIVTACANAGITSFRFGTANANFPAKELIKSDRRQSRFVVGTAGKFDVGRSPVSFDAYYQHGENHTHVDLNNLMLSARYTAAIDAVRNGSGQIVCRVNADASTTNDDPNCIPLNIFGGFPLTPAQFEYLDPSNGPFQRSVFKEDVASVSFNATPFSTWAGAASLALGAEYRKEAYVARADPYGNGVTADSPNTADYPAVPLLNSGGNNWFAGNYHNGSGSFNVREAFAELGLPLADGPTIGKIDLDLAGRYAHYSTAGNAFTWKVGATWATPLDGLRLRGMISKDLRAPNLSELFPAPVTASQNVVNRATSRNVQVLATTIGNPDLKPEIAKTYEVGVVYRPKFLPGLSASIDYYNIRLKGAVSTLSNQQVVDLCQVQLNTDFCQYVKLTGTLGTADFPYVIIKPFNFGSLKASGFDVEASYTVNMGNAGRLLVRALATHAIDMISDPGIPGQAISQLAGNNGEAGVGVPRWKAYFSQSWTLSRLSIDLAERVISSGKINVDAIECAAPNCPASTVQRPTVDFNSIPGAAYVDLGARYKLRKGTEVYFKVDNLFNHRAPPFGATTLYDVIGRMYRAGIRFAL
jgi:iron complex outermembrane recepter protein